jgi:hypothetical protein
MAQRWRHAIWARTLLIVLCLAAPAFAKSADPLTLFSTEQRAQQHCPRDVVVWLNLPTGIYHFKGQRWYGRTKSGAFVCMKEADQTGDRGTRNGQ